MPDKPPKKPGKTLKDLSAKNVRTREAKEVRGGRDAASGLSTGRRQYKPV